MKVKKSFMASLTALSAFIAMPITVFADSGNAVKDILMDQRFEGAMSRITWLTEMVDNWFIQVITVTAFFIISMSLLKNVLAAAYCAFPVFFNKVHEAHNQMKWSEQSIGGFKEIGSKLKDGKISDVILSIIPDFKALTDFAEQEMSPKTYFMKAIPQMCIMVIIGIFIYNGYYRDVSATVGEAGATIVENVLGSVSPEKAVNDLFNMKTDPKNTYRNDKTIEGGYIKELSNAMYKEVKNYSTVLKSSSKNKEALLRSCEYVAYNIVKGQHTSGLADWSGTESPFKGTETYDFKLSNVMVSIISQPTGGYCTTDTSDGSRAFRYELDWKLFTGNEDMESEENLKKKTIVITGNLTPQAKSNKTFETTIAAIEGDFTDTNAAAGFTAVKITASSGVERYKDNNGREYAYVDLTALTGQIDEELKKQCTANGYGYAGDVRFTGQASASNKIQITPGVETNVCSVTFTYEAPSTKADGTPGDPTKKNATVSLYVTAN